MPGNDTFSFFVGFREQQIEAKEERSVASLED